MSFRQLLSPGAICRSEWQLERRRVIDRSYRLCWYTMLKTAARSIEKCTSANIRGTGMVGMRSRTSSTWRHARPGNLNALTDESRLKRAQSRGRIPDPARHYLLLDTMGR